MPGYRTIDEFVPVPSAFTEIAPSTLVGLFDYAFPESPADAIYIRPGPATQQDYLVEDGSEWLLYTRSVMSYRIELDNHYLTPGGGASLIVELGDIEFGAVPVMIDSLVFHLTSGTERTSSVSGIELPGLVARFKIRTGNLPVRVRGSIIVRAI